ncbi:MAG: TraM recognition domain-containing protein [Coprococcus sp.]
MDWKLNDKILATMRSRGISCSIIIQNIAQMKVVLWTLS